MTKAYLISTNNIVDMDRYTHEYLPVGGDTLRKYDAKPIVVEFAPEPVVGEWKFNHTFVAEFPSTQAAQGWQNDPTFNSDELDRLRDAVFAEHNWFLAPEFDPENFESSHAIEDNSTL